MTPSSATLSDHTVSVVGFSGIPMTLPLSHPALTKLGKQTLKHRYLISPQVPVNLMGRNLLIKLGVAIMCSADGLTVTLPGGTQLACLGATSKNQYLVQDCEPATADIYWGWLIEDGILRQYQLWRPWIMSLAVYSPPRDPYHVTLFYDREDDDVYWEQFESELEGPMDVGLASCSPVLFQLKTEAPINRPQYRHKPEAEEGIAETIDGLLKWKRAGFRTATNAPIPHKKEMEELEKALDDPDEPVAKPEAGKFLLPKRPGEEIVIDFTDMIDAGLGGVRYLLVCVDALTGWPEAWATKREDAKSVIKCLINDYIPRHGFPKRIRSDNGTHFKNQDLAEVERMLGVQHKFGTVYHPQSQGKKVERMNPNLKNKLAKICAQTGLNWVTALPIALMTIRCSVNQSTGFTPYELLTGSQFPAPWTEVLVTSGRPTADGGVPDVKAVWLKVIKRKWKEPAGPVHTRPPHETCLNTDAIAAQRYQRDFLLKQDLQGSIGQWEYTQQGNGVPGKTWSIEHSVPNQ
ncbi:uncharacterized protein LOC102210013 [Pundamilia nyererei]|uniref:Uncharacterized protein LOC102210013 n=1 Tax=Pundamilia nyererei TaxID=303518 RepID=A0A9Y6MB50_9CICH|nr:PREDICTED: uncharacterized protein LOC102210013 [Pundamilia nyererei]